MKIPKTLRAFGYTWKIKKTKDIGGTFDFNTHTVNIGNEYGEQEVNFLHEIIEATLLELSLRFYGQENSMQYQFHFNHTEFTNFVNMLYQVLKDNKII